MSELDLATLGPPKDPVTAPQPWWQRADLHRRDGRLFLGKCDLDSIAGKLGTPAYVLRAPRVAEKLALLHGALTDAGLTHRVFYAIKANRSPKLLTYLAQTGLCGADVCSPAELRLAYSCGFPEDQISFTGTSLSAGDIGELACFGDVRVNLDSLSALEKLGRACPGRAVGLRINPDIGIGYGGNEMLQYSGTAATKFGIYLDRLPEAIAIAQTHGLRITRLHFHAGCGYLDRELDQLSAVLRAAESFIAQLPDLKEVNIGGGLGVPHRRDDQPLDLARWAATVAEVLGPHGVEVAVEPGDFLVKDAGVLLTRVTYVEQRKEVAYLGLDAGFNLAMEPAFYDLPCEPVPAVARAGATTRFTVVGNVNEALDKWAEDHPLPAPQEGDTMVLINAGGYAASMRSDHCLRGEVQDLLLLE